MPHLLIQGWRFLPHSYALVNQFQCLEMLSRPGLTLYHEDAPFHVNWRPTRGVLDARREQILAQIPAPPQDQPMDAVYRISYPYNLSPGTSPRTVVFGTAEFSVVPPNYILNGTPLPQAMEQSNLIVVTPSNWSRDGFIASGADPTRVQVIPHGIDPAIFHPISSEDRAAIRKRYNWDDSFVFLNIGAMTANKNIPILLRAFAVIAAEFPQARLALKGLDSLYPSEQLLRQAGKNLTQAEQSLIEPRLTFWGNMLSMNAMAGLYNGSDAYVSPYIAEAFNLPVLEAAACGLPVICSAGGATDDFITPEFCLPITSQIVSVPGQAGKALGISFDGLVEQMRRAIVDQDYVAKARSFAPAFIAEHYTWKIVVDKLLEVLFPTLSPV